MKNRWISPLPQIFFGLTSENAAEFRSLLFKQIHEIVFYGNGGYDWPTVYNMPIWLRNFTFQQIMAHFEKVNKSKQTVEESINNMKQAQNNVTTPSFSKTPKKNTQSPFSKVQSPPSSYNMNPQKK